MPNVYDFSVKTIDGVAKSLKDYEGKVLLVVNVASQCGYTPQYAGLEALHQGFAERGLRVLGFPANEFGAQEPGSNAEIKAFCTSKFNVGFDMFAKVKVKGDGIDPLFAHLCAATGGAELKWNFNKFLVGRRGEVLARFESKVAPDAPELKLAIETTLGG